MMCQIIHVQKLFPTKIYTVREKAASAINILAGGYSCILVPLLSDEYFNLKNLKTLPKLMKSKFDLFSDAIVKKKKKKK